MPEFILGFTVTWMFLMHIVGGVAAVAALVLIVAITLLVAGALFDAITSKIATRWRRKGREPRTKLARIIMQSDAKP